MQPAATETSNDTVLGDELAWEALSHEAMQAHQNGRSADAIILWRRAAALTPHFCADDPRHAASLSNLAAADALSDQLEPAEKGFRAAGRAWEMARGWTRTMAVTGSARSSLFHHRLETKHRDWYNQHLRDRFCRSIDVGDAATAFNHGVVLACLDKDETGRQRIAAAMELQDRAFGADEASRGVIAETFAALYGPGETVDRPIAHDEGTALSGRLEALQRWWSSRPPQINDERRLSSAVRLTAIFSWRDFM